MNVRQLAARVDPGRPVAPTARPAPGTPPRNGAAFDDVLRQAGGVRLSAHAQQRLAARHIAFDDDARQSISDAMEHLAGKGAQNALLLRADAAFVVNVPNRTVVTALGQQEMQHRAFTDIDSAMLL